MALVQPLLQPYSWYNDACGGNLGVATGGNHSSLMHIGCSKRLAGSAWYTVRPPGADCLD